MEPSDHDRVARRAHELWEAAGSPEGEAESFWFQAEQEDAAENPGQDRVLDKAELPQRDAPAKRSGKKPTKTGAQGTDAQ